MNVARSAGVLVLAACVLGAGATARADDFTVTKLGDSADGACDADCSLREAIIEANAILGSHTVTLPAGHYVLTIASAGSDTEATGDLDIDNGLTITGAGPGLTTIDATGLGDRVFEVGGGHTVTLSALTITGGDTTPDGGGIYNYGSILTLDNVEVVGNQSAHSGGGVYCGWVGEVHVINGSLISDNHAGANYSGGGLWVSKLVLSHSTVSGNSAGHGGGVSTGMAGETSSITDSTITGNQDLGGDGGGIAIEDATATVTIENSTIHGNSTQRFGGGVWVGGAAHLQLKNVTISDNDAPAGNGSALHKDGQVDFTNTAIVGACNGSGFVISHDGNLESPGNSCSLGAGDQVNVGGSLLGPLAANGGPTMTRLPTVGSPAIDSGSGTPCPSFDQRGEARNDGNCDVGAVELKAGDPAVLFYDGFESGTTDYWFGS